VGYRICISLYGCNVNLCYQAVQKYKDDLEWEKTHPRPETKPRQMRVRRS
jgi:hypothetical protein